MNARTTAADLAASGGCLPLAPDLDEARRFLDLLDPDAETFTFQTFDDSPRKSSSLGKTWCDTLDGLAGPLTRMQESSAGVFVTVNACRGRRRRAEDVVRVRAVFTDLDGSPLEPAMACDLEPHVVVETSPSRWHCYWLCEDVPLDLFEGIQKSIAARFSGDEVHDLSRVMRMPGFWHQKGAPHLSRIVHAAERLPYHVSELLAEFPPVPAAVRGNGHDAEHVDFAELVRLVLSSEDYHAALVRIAYRLTADGVARPKVVATMQGLMNNAAGPRDDRWQARYNDIERAVDTATDKVVAVAHTGRVEDLEPEPEPESVVESHLTPDQPPWEDPTDAPMFYGPLGDLARKLDPLTEADPKGVLACLVVMFGNWLGREFYLLVGADRHTASLYALLVGPSATGRKGTACGLARLCMDVLDHGWTSNNVFRSLNSGPGIVQTVKNLQDKTAQQGPSDRRALFVVAEFADVLAKASLAGNTILTTMRDCWDNGSLDNTSVSRPTRVRDASVSLIGMTTFEDLTEHLDLRELATGTLNRVLLVKVARSKVLPDAPVITAETVKPIVDRLAANVDRLRKAFIIMASSISKPLILSQDAKARARQLKAEAEQQGKTWVDAGNARAYVQTLRVALVFAVADGSKHIEVVHLDAARDFVRHASRGLSAVARGELKDRIAQRILTHMREDATETLTRTGISSAVFNRNCPAKDLENALHLLVKLGLLAERLEPTPGRPKTVYQLITQ